MRASFITIALLFSVVSAAPRPVRRQFQQKNVQDAVAQNKQFAGLNANSPCQAGQDACIQDKFAQCVGGKFVIQPCAPGTICAALPLVNKPGTSITCTTTADRDRRLGGAAAVAPPAKAAPPPKKAAPPAKAPPAKGNNNAGKAPPAKGNNNAANNNAQESLTLDPSVIAKGFAQNGQAKPDPGQVPSLTSTNNFINFCKGQTITDGKQVRTGSCNPAPMGQIPSVDNMPSAKFIFPANFGKVPAGKPFTVQMAISKLETGNFVNANQNYFAAPQQLNNQGVIRGHSHVVIEKLSGFDQKTPTDPKAFIYFKGLNNAAKNGVITAEIAKGLKPGAYRIASINTAANHQPALVPIAQHGSLDDAVYFTAE